MMEQFLVLSFLFIFGASVGWCMEFVFRRIAHHQWINPGFLTGPYLPLYGFGVVILFLVARLFEWIDFSFLGDSLWVRQIATIIIMSVSMTVIEYIAGLIFIRGMHIKLWDYSGQWGNIQGIICPLFSLAWTAVAAFYLLVLDPALVQWTEWFVARKNLYYFIGVIYGVLFVDIGYSFHISSKIRTFAKEHNIVVAYENFKAFILKLSAEKEKKKHYVLPFRPDFSLKEALTEYKNRVKEIRDTKKREKQK